MRHALLRLGDWFLNSYWVVPALCVTGALVLSLVMVTLDERGVALGDLRFIYTREAEGARQLLTTIADAIATIAGVVFSITLVTLTLASNTFGSRILRNFSRDTGSKIVLGVMLGTFVYSLMVVRTISQADGEPFVPHLSVLVGIVLALLSLATLIYFIHHTVSSIQPESMIARLAGEAHALVNELYPEELGKGDGEMPEPRAPHGDYRPAYASHSGYVASVDKRRLFELACRQDLVVRLLVRPGEFVHRGAPVAEALGSSDAEVLAALAKVLEIGPRRTYVEDLDFALQQITLVAVRALSPAVNDPFTAITCVDRLGAIFIHLAQRKMPSQSRYDDEGRLRIIAPRLELRELVESAFVPILESGRGSYTVMAALLRTASKMVAPTRFGTYRKAFAELREQVHRVGRAPMDEELRTRFDQLHQTLRGDVPGPRLVGG